MLLYSHLTHCCPVLLIISTCVHVLGFNEIITYLSVNNLIFSLNQYLLSVL